jgi:hypothetical protein
MGRTIRDVLDLLISEGFEIDRDLSRNGRWVLRRGTRVVSFTGRPDEHIDQLGEYGILKQAGLV